MLLAGAHETKRMPGSGKYAVGIVKISHSQDGYDWRPAYVFEPAYDDGGAFPRLSENTEGELVVTWVTYGKTQWCRSLDGKTWSQPHRRRARPGSSDVQNRAVIIGRTDGAYLMATWHKASEIWVSSSTDPF